MNRSRTLIYVIAVLSFLISIVWFFSQLDYEPFLAIISSFGAIIALLTADDLNDYNLLLDWMSRQPEIVAFTDRLKQRFQGTENLSKTRQQLLQILRRYHWAIWLISAVLAVVFIAQVIHIPFDLWMKWKARQVFLENFWASRFANCENDLWVTQLNFDDLKGFIAVKAKPEDFEIKTIELNKSDTQKGDIWAGHIVAMPSASRMYRKESVQNDQSKAGNKWSSFVNGFDAAQAFNLYGVNSEIVLKISYNKDSGWAINIPSGWYSEAIYNIIENVIVQGMKAPICADVPK